MHGYNLWGCNENNNQFLLSTTASEESNTVDVLIYAGLQYVVQSASTKYCGIFFT